jgi:hypothetical protein
MIFWPAIPPLLAPCGALDWPRVATLGTGRLGVSASRPPMVGAVMRLGSGDPHHGCDNTASIGLLFRCLAAEVSAITAP